MSEYHFDWSELAFASKKPLRSLRAVFIAAPRELSEKRFVQLIKAYLPHANLVFGLAKEQYVDGFDGQPQFKMLRAEMVQPIIDKVNASKSPHKVYTLDYFQRELPHILEKGDFKKAIFVNGSWQRSFHLRPEFYMLVNSHIAYELVSPFVDEAEAQAYEASIQFSEAAKKEAYSAEEMLQLASQVAQKSFDYSFQTGAVLGKKAGKHYKLLAESFNRVVPFQTFAMHHGAAREKYFSPANDANYYDAVHAEVNLLIAAQKQAINLSGTTLFINLLPCPTCARMLVETDIAEIIYQQDHSDGYAVALLERAGKKVTRLVPKEVL